MRKFNRRIQKPKSFDRKPKKKYTGPKDTGLTVYVREGNVDRALRTFKKKVKNANIMQDLNDCRWTNPNLPDEPPKLVLHPGKGSLFSLVDTSLEYSSASSY